MDLCDSSIKPQEARPLYSPTTPIIEPQIETATASQILPFLYLGKFSQPFGPTQLITHKLPKCTESFPPRKQMPKNRKLLLHVFI